jgi:hypothetical protein
MLLTILMTLATAISLVGIASVMEVSKILHGFCGKTCNCTYDPEQEGWLWFRKIKWCTAAMKIICLMNFCTKSWTREIPTIREIDMEVWEENSSPKYTTIQIRENEDIKELIELMDSRFSRFSLKVSGRKVYLMFPLDLTMPSVKIREWYGCVVKGYLYRGKRLNPNPNNMFLKALKRAKLDPYGDESEAEKNRRA